MLGVIRHQSSKKYMIRRCYITIQKICYTHTHTRLTAFFCDYSGEPVPERENQSGFYWSKKTVSGSGISWDVCKSACRSRQITTPAPHHSVFYRPDALPAAQPPASKHCTNYLKITRSMFALFRICRTFVVYSQSKISCSSIKGRCHGNRFLLGLLIELTQLSCGDIR